MMADYNSDNIQVQNWLKTLYKQQMSRNTTKSSKWHEHPV